MSSIRLALPSKVIAVDDDGDGVDDDDFDSDVDDDDVVLKFAHFSEI